MACKSNSTWDILLAMEATAKALAGNMLTAKSQKLQTKYMGTRKTRITWHEVPMFIWGFFADYGLVKEVSSLKSKTGITTSEFEIMRHYPPEIYRDPHVLN